MLYRTKEIINRNWFNMRCRGILSTPPIKIKKSDLVFLSMVSHRDLLMYLIALKSFYNYINRGEVVILDDGTLTSQDITLLKSQILPLNIINIDKIDIGKCPRRICWERLLLIADHVKNDYVIQVDADTVTVNDIPEVAEYIEKGVSFTLGTEADQRFQDVKSICERMKKEDGIHVQELAEQNLDRLTNSNNRKYARGCAGFAGFAKGSFSRKEVEDFSEEMGSLVGHMWKNWGSDQVASNFIISNSPRAAILPYPKYASYYPQAAIDYEDSSFLHFIGKNRFENDLYIKKAQEVIRSR